MAEPSTTTFTITVAAAAVLGPLLGPYALVAFSAAAGSLLALSRKATLTRPDGLRFIVVGMLISLVLTASVVWLIEKYTPIPSHISLMPVAFFLALGRCHLLTLMDKGADALGGLIERVLGKKGSTP